MGRPTAIGVELHLGFFPLLLLLHFARPFVAIDDCVVPSAWGTHHLHLSPGWHRIVVYYQNFFQAHAGRASLDILVGEGRTLCIRYRFSTPWAFAKGRLWVE